MKKKYLRKFVALFAGLPEAELILSDNIRWLNRDILDAQLEIISTNESIEEVNDPNSELLMGLFDEIDHNLYKHPLNQREYIEDLLICFKDLARFIDEKEFYGDEPDELDFFDMRYRDYGATRRLWAQYAEDFERYAIDHYSPVEQYVLNCYCLMYTFFSFLDGRCVHFKLDLMQIQNDMNIFLNRRRYVDHLEYAGYSFKVKQLGLDNEIKLKALPPSPVNEVPVIKPFTEWLHHDDPESLAKLCKDIFNRNQSPRDYAVMLSLLLENHLIYLQNNHRKDFYESWYTFIDRPFPSGDNYHAINKFTDVFRDGVRFFNDSDPDYINLSREFEKELQALNKKAV